MQSQRKVYSLNICLRTECITQDFANPLVRPHLQLYPVISTNGISEVWHGEKLVKDIPDHVLTPMIKLEGRHFYVGELVRLKCGRYFIPLRWIEKDGEMQGEGHWVDGVSIRFSSTYSYEQLTKQPISGRTYRSRLFTTFYTVLTF